MSATIVSASLYTHWLIRCDGVRWALLCALRTAAFAILSARAGRGNRPPQPWFGMTRSPLDTSYWPVSTCVDMCHPVSPGVTFVSPSCHIGHNCCRHVSTCVNMCRHKNFFHPRVIKFKINTRGVAREDQEPVAWKISFLKWDDVVVVSGLVVMTRMQQTLQTQTQTTHLMMWNRLR